MQVWLATIVVQLITNLGSWLMARALEAIHSKQQQASTDSQIDQRLAGVKAAYKEAFNGQPVTPDQRAKLNQAIADFIRGPSGTGV